MEAYYPAIRSLAHFQRFQPEGKNLLLGKTALHPKCVAGLPYLAEARMKLLKGEPLGCRLSDCCQTSAWSREIYPRMG